MTENLTFDQLPKAVTTLTKEVRELKSLLLKKSEHQNNEPLEKILTIQEASNLLNLAVPTIYSKVSKGQLPVMKRSSRLYFSSTELMKYLKGGRKKSNSEIEADAEKYLTSKK